MRLKPFTFLLAATFCLPGLSAWAGLSFVLTPATQLGARSNAVVFTGMLSNTSLTDNLYLNDIQFSFTGVATNYLSGNSNTFFANVPGVLVPGETYSDVVYAVAIEASTPPGNYSGEVTVFCGTNIFEASNLATQTFVVSVFDTPFDVWRFEQFGINTNNTAISGELADPDSDRILNLLEYALNLDPNVADVTGLPAPQIDSACNCLTLTYTKVLGATDLIYSPEAVGDLGDAWGTNGVAETIIDATTGTQTIKASDSNYPVASATNRFMHLRITPMP